MKLHYISILILLIIGCTQASEMGEDSRDESVDLQMVFLEHDLIAMLGLSDSFELNTVFDFKMMDSSGKVTNIGLQKAIASFHSNVKMEGQGNYPLFEVKNSSKVILPAYGNGLWDRIWALVLIDKTSLEVQKVEFFHKAETPGLGALITHTSFTNQFVGSTVTFSENTYSLVQGDKVEIEGENRIDGISGATITSKGAVNMLNEKLKKYQAYFE